MAQALIPPDVRLQVAKRFADLRDPVYITVFAGEGGEAGEALRRLVGELSEISPLIRVAEGGASDGILSPSMNLSRTEGVRSGVWFNGFPGGYEFGTFLDDLIDLSRDRVTLSERTLEALRGIDKRLTIDVFTTPT